ncbi:UvrD-helicase domain-containing protein, partial [Anaeromyxobacter terrae]|uniref:UvrD-helicase domain-containing protein n=1 Tax=Anaeromyxobacter terrae TaxID=2925406 RepID=UPI001F5A7712
DVGPPEAAPERPAETDAARARLVATAEAIALAGPQAASAGARDLVEGVRRALDALAPSDRQGEIDAAALGRLLALAAAGKGKRLGKGDGPLRELKDALAAASEALAPLAAEALAADAKAELCRLVADAEARYAARKRAARAVDFDDLLVLARDLLRRDAALRSELRARYRALLVDEYQDVNGVQQELFELLAGPGTPRGPILVAVGDLKQSIYRFRGADVAVFARLVRRLDAGEGRVLYLSDNHRSAPAVVDLVNEVFARCMRPPDGASPRDDEIRFSDADRLVPHRPEGSRPACELLEDAGEGNAAERRRREADAIARRIEAVVAGTAGVAVRERGDGPGGGERVRCPRLGDVAILFRRLTQIGEYERALRAAGIPYRLARGGGFYQAPEVRDLGELLATLADPADAIGWAAVLRSPMCGVSDSTLLLAARAGLGWIARAHAGGLPDEILRALSADGAGALAPGAAEQAVRGVPAEDWARLARLLEVWRELHALRDRLAPDALLGRAVERLDLDAALLAGPDGERRAMNVAKAVALAARFAADGGTAAELARHLRAQAARPPREPEAEVESGDAVAILTVHQAKGLEWPVVFVPDLGARARSDARRALLDPAGRVCAMRYDAAAERFDETASVRDARDHERRASAAESRRLLYVAMTRARDHLVLSGEASNGAESWRGLVEAAVAARPELARRIPIAEAGTAAAGPPIAGAGLAAAPLA